jgi:outer membrane protein W
MKKMYLMAVIAIAAISVNAQESDLKPFKVDVSAGYAIPGGKGSKGGVLFVVEPKYAVMSNVALGLRLETAVIARVSGFDATGAALNADVKASASYLATGDYYFSDNYSFRPFAGAGAGLFKLASASVTASGAENSGVGSKFGGMIRAGFEASHFRLGLEYNLIPKTQVSGFDANGAATKVDSKNGYIGIKFGVCFGGGRR